MTSVPPRLQARAVTRTFTLGTSFFHGASQHAPNEHLPPEVLREALGVMTGLYWDLGAGNTPKSAS